MAIPYRLRSCVWEITLACCFSCRYCGSRGGRARENELSTDECLRVADELSELGCRRVSLIGGEVFLRSDWPAIVERLTSRGIRASIITNGFLFDERLIEELKAVRIESIAISIDGPEAIHDKYRQAGSHQRAMRALRSVTGAGIPASVITTVNRESAAHLEELYAALLEYPIFAWQIQACSPMGNAAKFGIDFYFDPNQVIQFLSAHRDRSPFRMGIADNIGYYTQEEGRLRGGPEGACFPGCGAGLSSIGIDSVGNVRGCESMYDDAFIEGNLREKSLREIWENPDSFAYNRRFRRELLTGACAQCEYGAHCAGGCRSYNYFVHRKLYESPACARQTRQEAR